MSTFLQDALIDTAGTLLENHTVTGMGGVWQKSTVNTGSGEISPSGDVRAAATNTTCEYLNAATPPSANYFIQCDLVPLDSTRVGNYGLSARSSVSADTGYSFFWFGSSSGWALYKHVAGTDTQLGSTISATLVTGGTYTLLLSVNGTTITGYVNSTQVIQQTDAAVSAAGLAGLTFGAGSSTPSDTSGIHIRNVIAGTAPFTLSPTSAYASTGLTITATGIGTAWTTGTTFSVSGGTGASISGLSVNASTQVATFNLNPGSTAGVLTITDSTAGSTAPLTVLASPTSNFLQDSLIATGGTLLEYHTPNVGGTWQKNAVNTGQMEASPSGDARATVTGAVCQYTNTAAPPSANYFAQCDLVPIDSVRLGNYGVIVRAQQSADTFYVFFWFNGTGWALYKHVAGVATQLGSTVPATLTTGATYTIQIRANGTTITGLVNGVQTIQVTDSSISAAGFAGITSSPNSSTPGDTTGIHARNIVAGPLAPAFSLTPATVVVSTNATVTATGTSTSWTSGTTFSVGGGTGASISSISVNASTQVATFTLVPGSTTGTLTISDSTDSATAPITVTLPPVVIGVSSTARLESPGYWTNPASGRTGGTSRQNWRIGSWVKYFWSTTSASPTALLNMSNATTGSSISIAVNGVRTDGITVPSSGGVSLSSYLSGAGSYELQVWFQASAQSARWNYGNALVDAGLTLDLSATPGTAPAARPWALLVGDSITEAINANTGAVPDFMVGYALLLSQGFDQLGYDYGIDACGYRGYLVAGDSTNDVPPWYLVSGGVYNAAGSAWSKIDASNSLLDANGQISSYGATGTAPAMIIIMFGSNEARNLSSTSDLTAAVTQSLITLRSSAAPSAQIRIILFFGAYTGTSDIFNLATALVYATAVRAGVTNYLSTYPGDTKTKLIDLGPIVSTTLMAFNGYTAHPQIAGHAFAAGALGGPLGLALAPTTGSEGGNRRFGIGL